MLQDLSTGDYDSELMSDVSFQLELKASDS